MHKLINGVLDLLFVPKCGGCGVRMDNSDNGLCKKCLRAYDDERAEYCDFCGMEASICSCIPYHLMLNGCIDYRKLIFYKSSAKGSVAHKIIYNIKRSHNRALMAFFAKELCDIDKNSTFEDAIVTYAPRSRESLKKYGYDQSALIAKHYSKNGGYKFKKLLKSKFFAKRTQQKLLNYKQRAANIKDVFILCNEKSIKGKTVILIDDVVTSGVTLGECTALLYSAGAKSVICRSIAYTYKKNKQKND